MELSTCTDSAKKPFFKREELAHWTGLTALFVYLKVL
jgi:hypothetical protein